MFDVQKDALRRGIVVFLGGNTVDQWQKICHWPVKINGMKYQ